MNHIYRLRIIGLILISLILPAVACGGDTSNPNPVDNTDVQIAPTDLPPVEQPSIQSEASYAVEDCPFDIPDGYDMECGYLTVPENRSDPNSATIDLAVAIVRVDNPASDPIIYLAGGPGSSAIDEFVSAPESWDINQFLYGSDLILLDQRGTGYSYPTLNCWEMEQAAENSISDYDAAVACHDRLVSDGIDLTAYNSAESAADVEDLRIALGYDTWNLFGISYGTRLALEVMRDYPDGIRSVIIDFGVSSQR